MEKHAHLSQFQEQRKKSGFPLLFDLNIFNTIFQNNVDDFIPGIIGFCGELI